MILDLEETFTVGEDAYFDCVSTSSSYGVVFEDDLETGYFYAVDAAHDLQVLDALHIYNVADVIDKHKSSTIQIAWSDDGLVACLVINYYCHAVFDFGKKAGYCRNAFPENNSGWAHSTERLLTDDLVSKYFHRSKG